MVVLVVAVLPLVCMVLLIALCVKKTKENAPVDVNTSRSTPRPKSDGSGTLNNDSRPATLAPQSSKRVCMRPSFSHGRVCPPQV